VADAVGQLRTQLHPAGEQLECVAQQKNERGIKENCVEWSNALRNNISCPNGLTVTDLYVDECEDPRSLFLALCDRTKKSSVRLDEMAFQRGSQAEKRAVTYLSEECLINKNALLRLQTVKKAGTAEDKHIHGFNAIYRNRIIHRRKQSMLA